MMYDTVTRCPACGNHNSRPSIRPRMMDMFMRFFGLIAYRCRVCQVRFYDRPVPEEKKEA